MYCQSHHHPVDHQLDLQRVHQVEFLHIAVPTADPDRTVLFQRDLLRDQLLQLDALTEEFLHIAAPTAELDQIVLFQPDQLQDLQLRRLARTEEFLHIAVPTVEADQTV